MGRLSQQQLEALQEKALAFHRRLVTTAKQRVTDEEGQAAFFAALFQLAAVCIEGDVDRFCDRADEVFEEIEAVGQEPMLDIDWLAEVTGDQDNFYFSTDTLVSDLVPLPRRKRRQHLLSHDEIDRLKKEIEQAIIEDDGPLNLQQALAGAHSENVQHWIDAIKNALEKEGGKTDFWLLHNITQLPPVELFLGVLLGYDYWSIRQDDGFGKTITVTLYADHP
ncbi:MAG: hypothetical protein HC800_12105 [Phormidesmis sp. RL_2_1]|nr:hypothetical protein [Phormidesmis sp. RL_2_1]